jgi:rhodanese-related sulfurtransferase
VIARKGGGGLTMTFGSYAGDLDVIEVWPRLTDDPTSSLVDVRTRPEWRYVGLPNLESIGKSPILLEWQSYPTMKTNPDFVSDLKAEIGRRGLHATAPIYFLCRSGARSRAAAIEATAAGFSAAYNVAGGFEGPVGPDGHRGGVLGWKAAGLPWLQS